MRTAIRSILTVLLLGLTTLAACNTIEGVGEDIEAGGEALSDTSRKVRQSF